jgi:hypothetical protein
LIGKRLTISGLNQELDGPSRACHQNMKRHSKTSVGVLGISHLPLTSPKGAEAWLLGKKKIKSGFSLIG